MNKCLAGLVLVFSLVSFLPSVALAKITYSPDANYAIVTGQNMMNAEWNTAAADVLSTLGNEWHLATITSQAEQDYVLNLMKTESIHELWLGAYQNPLTTTDPKANWTQVTGEPWDYKIGVALNRTMVLDRAANSIQQQLMEVHGTMKGMYSTLPGMSRRDIDITAGFPVSLLSCYSVLAS